MVTEHAWIAATGAPLQPLPLPAGLTGLYDAHGTLCLLPSDPAACTRLLLHCRQLARVTANTPASADPCLPGTGEIEWVVLPGTGLLPLPRLPAPKGAPLATWIGTPAAQASDLVTITDDLLALLDHLVAAGFHPQPFPATDLWVHGSHLSWLPATLGWPQPGRHPTASLRQAASRTAGIFLRDLLQQARSVPGCEQVWEELWTLCYQLLDEPPGVNSAWRRAELQALQARLRGDRTAAPSPDRWVIVDAVSLQQTLGYRSLDLTGLLCHLLGTERHIRGSMLGSDRLPASWRAVAADADLTWVQADAAPLPLLGEQARLAGTAEMWLITGRPDPQALTAVRPPRGRCLALAPERPLLPAPWSWVACRWEPWLHLGWPKSERREVPANG